MSSLHYGDHFVIDVHKGNAYVTSYNEYVVMNLADWNVIKI